MDEIFDNIMPDIMCNFFSLFSFALRFFLHVCNMVGVAFILQERKKSRNQLAPEYFTAYSRAI